MAVPEPQPAPATPRFARKREAILDEATRMLNREGVKGMTLAGVAAGVGLITTSVTYYFKKKEDLAAAVFLRGIERLDAVAEAALAPAAPVERVRALIDGYLDLRRRIVLREAPPLAVLNDTRTLGQPHRAEVDRAYGAMFRKVRRIFDSPDLSWMDRKLSTARTHMLLDQLYWLPAWLRRYDLEDYGRVRDRMTDILVHGLAQPGAAWAPRPLRAPVAANADEAPASRETFLRAATALINERGYRGASVDQISARLNVTKGSFYHHNEGKDDLVVDCFERSFVMTREVQAAARALPADQWIKLSSAAAALVELQLSEEGPLLRTSALSALPTTTNRDEMIERSNRVSDRFAAMISDGIAEGAVRAVDPAIAAQMLKATLNAAAELRYVVHGVERGESAALYAKPMLMGLFSR